MSIANEVVSERPASGQVELPSLAPIRPAAERPRPATSDREVIKVCHVSMCLETGGLERLLVDFSRFHDRRRFATQFVAFCGDGQPAADIRAAGCAARVLNNSERVPKRRTLRELSRLLRTERVGIVHTHNTFAGFYGAVAAKLARVPIVVNTQHGPGCGNSWKARWQFRLANRLTDRIVGVSRDAVTLCRQQDSHSAHKLTGIWNGINLHRFEYRGSRLAPIAISVARLSPEKDFPMLLQATRLVVNEWPEFRLRIVGDGDERTTIERLRDELSLRDHVELLGERSDVANLLAESGFFVSASRSEGISLTLLEAMAVGLPVVTTKIGGNPEVVVDGKTGRLAAAGNPAALAGEMIAMLQEMDAWIAMGVLARRRVEEHFEIRQMVESYEALYDELWEQRTRDRGVRSKKIRA